MTRYLEIVFRSKLRLAALVLVLPLSLCALDLYLWRSYDASEVVWVDDPNTFGQAAAAALGYNPYLTPSQNAVLLFSNLIGTQTFNNALGDKLVADGVIHSDRERAALTASLGQLTVSPGGLTTAGTAGGTAYSPNLTMTIRYVCTNETLCLSVLAAVLDVYRSEYSNLKARAAATARTIYENQLKVGEAQLATAVAALQHYDALPKKSTRGQPAAANQDPVRNSLQHDVDQAEREIDQSRTQLQNIDTFAQVSNGITGDMVALDPPKTLKGLLGIKGLRNDNLKTDAIVWAVCLGAAAIYLILVAFMDRTVRDPDEIKNRLGKAVITIPDYQQVRPRRGAPLKKAA